MSVNAEVYWPYGQSINDGTPSDSFLGKSIILTHPTIDTIADDDVEMVFRTRDMGTTLYR